ncbi:condensation domain-containing protein, partial [Actinoplanes sp. NPDC051346]|uniref:condensation domain-containing protein n=1 Tax=Actinoplanes sp. NPDC051346 TaxID=3155048 RepID=UPI00341EEF25
MTALSSAQRRLWFLYRLEGPSSTYNIPVVATITGEVDGPALIAAVNDVVERHEILRTVYVEADGEPSQQVLPIGEGRVDAAQERLVPEALAAAVEDTCRRAFDLAVEAPLRVRLFSTSTHHHTLVIVLHHIAG